MPCDIGRLSLALNYTCCCPLFNSFWCGVFFIYFICWLKHSCTTHSNDECDNHGLTQVFLFGRVLKVKILIINRDADRRSWTSIERVFNQSIDRFAWLGEVPVLLQTHYFWEKEELELHPPRQDDIVRGKVMRGGRDAMLDDDDEKDEMFVNVTVSQSVVDRNGTETKLDQFTFIDHQRTLGWSAPRPCTASDQLNWAADGGGMGQAVPWSSAHSGGD